MHTSLVRVMTIKKIWIWHLMAVLLFPSKNLDSAFAKQKMWEMWCRKKGEHESREGRAVAEHTIWQEDWWNSLPEELGGESFNRMGNRFSLYGNRNTAIDKFKDSCGVSIF